MKTKLFLLSLLSALGAHAQGTAFTYQGRLNDAAGPVSGTYDFQFTVRDALTNGNAVGVNPLAATLAVSNGLFTATLDPGPGVFTGMNRWLEIAVKTNGAALFTTLSPRQKITAAPYAIYAGGVTASGISGTIAPVNIGAGSLTTVMFAAGAVGANQLAAGAVTTAALADGAVTAPKLATGTNWYGLMIANPTPAVSDNFGWALAALGSDRVLIGANADDTGATDAGAAYLFRTNGTLLTTFTNPFPADGDNFGVSVAPLGNDRVLIGAYAGATNAGAAYLFSTSGALLTTFTNPTPAALDYFGYRVTAVGSDRVLIGAYGDDTGAAQAGAAYLFRTNGTLLTTFTNPTPTVWGVFGWAVAAVGSDRVLISAFGTPPDGAAHLFTTNGTLLTTFTNPTPAVDDWFGISVAAVGSDRVLIGAQRDDTGAFDAGAAYLFRTNGTLLTTFTNPTPASSDWFGWSVAAVGSDRVLIGMRPDDTGGTKAGTAYLFTTNGTLLTTFNNPIPTGGGQFGNAVAAVGSDRVLIGARRDDTGATDAGVAYLFSVETYTPGLVAEAVRHGSITTASLADGAVTAAKIGGVLLASQIPNLDAAKITSGTLSAAALSNAWKIGGNAGATPGANFIGTTDTNALEFKVNNQRALRLEPNVNAPNVIGGSGGNYVAPGLFGATIGGGGLANHTNKVEVSLGTIAGGSANTVRAGGGFIGAGWGNLIDSNLFDGVISGGNDNTIEPGASYSTIAGGAANVISNGATFATIGGGYFNRAAASEATVAGGAFNSALGFSATVGGGGSNTVRSDWATIAGGRDNVLDNAGYAAIGGGYFNWATNQFATVPGGAGNTAGGQFSLAAGHDAKALHDGAFVWADSPGGGFTSTGNDQFLIRAAGGVGIGTNHPQSALHVNGTVTATDFSGNGAGLTNVTALTVGGLSSSNFWKTTGNAGTTAGANFLGTTDDEPLEFWVRGVRALRLEPKGASAPNLIGGAPNNLVGATAVGVTIGGGSFNTAASDHAVVGGGSHNTSGDHAVVGGGSRNNALSLYSTVSGGYENTSGPYATVPGGHLNSAGGPFGFAAGRRAKADHVGAFVWGDSTDANFASTANDQFSVRAAGGVRFTSGSGTANQTVAWVPGSASWTFSSDRNLKESVQAVDAQLVLEKVARLPVAQWNYIGYPQQHIGPMAQDFHALFPLNDSETTLNDADLHGVALAAIQGLNQKVEGEAAALRAENGELKRELTEIKQLLLQLAAQRN